MTCTVHLYDPITHILSILPYYHEIQTEPICSDNASLIQSLSQVYSSPYHPITQSQIKCPNYTIHSTVQCTDQLQVQMPVSSQYKPYQKYKSSYYNWAILLSLPAQRTTQHKSILPSQRRSSPPLLSFSSQPTESLLCLPCSKQQACMHKNCSMKCLQAQQ